MVSTNECQAMRLLARDGWTAAELKMTMHVSRNETVRLHVRGECSHEHRLPGFTDWCRQNGTGSPPARPQASERHGEVVADD